MGQWTTWSMWSCALSCATCLILDILTSFNLNHLSPSQGYFILILPDFLTNINFCLILFFFFYFLIFLGSMMSMPLKRKEPVPSPPARENLLTIFYMFPEMMEIKTISANTNVISRKALNIYFESGCCMFLLRYF